MYKNKDSMTLGMFFVSLRCRAINVIKLRFFATLKMTDFAFWSGDWWRLRRHQSPLSTMSAVIPNEVRNLFQ